MFKCLFVLGHSKAWLFYNRFLLCLKSVHIEKNRSTALSLRFAVWHSPNPSVAVCISSNKFDSLHSSSILFFSLVSKSFKVISLFSYQGSFVLCLTRQLLYITKSVSICQELFYLFFADRLICFLVARDSLTIISSDPTVVNTFFTQILINCNSSLLYHTAFSVQKMPYDTVTTAKREIRLISLRFSLPRVPAIFLLRFRFRSCRLPRPLRHRQYSLRYFRHHHRHPLHRRSHH